MDIKDPKRDLYCSTCGEKLTDAEEIAEETECPRIPGEIVCDDCWFDEYCDRCVLCDDYIREEDTEYVLIVEEFQGTLPGCYKFRRPWYADGMIEMYIYRHALTKVRDLLPGEDGDDSVSGYVCEECALKGVSA